VKRLVLASSNSGKIREFRELLAPLELEVVPQGELGVAEAEEPHATFVENALAKARHASSQARLPALADDSGICVAALGGEPGVHSARYGGPAAAAYPQKFALVYAGLLARGAMGSPARFVCALAVADGARILFEARGTIEGRVNDAPRGDGGFGYDPIFFYPPLGRTLAELDEHEKAAVSHRGQAFRQLRDHLASRPGWLR